MSRAEGQGFVSLGTEADTPDMLAKQSGYVLKATERAICAQPVRAAACTRSTSSLDVIYDTPWGVGGADLSKNIVALQNSIRTGYPQI